MTIKKKAAAKKKATRKTAVFTEITSRPPEKVDNNRCKTSTKFLQEHCFHSRPGYGNTLSGYSLLTDGYCCFCNLKESDLHGPYHPTKTGSAQATTITWVPATTTGTITSPTVSVGNDTSMPNICGCGNPHPVGAR